MSARQERERAVERRQRHVRRGLGPAALAERDRGRRRARRQTTTISRPRPRRQNAVPKVGSCGSAWWRTRSTANGGRPAASTSRPPTAPRGLQPVERRRPARHHAGHPHHAGPNTSPSDHTIRGPTPVSPLRSRGGARDQHVPVASRRRAAGRDHVEPVAPVRDVHRVEQRQLARAGASGHDPTAPRRSPGHAGAASCRALERPPGRS